MATERGRAANTIAAYRRDLTGYAALAGRARRATSTSVDTADARSTSSAERRASGAAPSSVARQLAAIRMLHRFLVDEGERGRRPDRRPRGRAGPGRAAQAAQRGRGDVAARRRRRRTTRSPLRDRALLELLYATGARISRGCAGCRWATSTSTHRLVRLFGKGSKERIVPFGRAAGGGARRVVRAARPGAARAGAVAPARRRRGGVPQPARRPARPARRRGRSSSSYGERAGIPAASCRRTCCATRARPTCSTTAPTCASCRSCSATRRSRRRRCTRRSARSGCARSTAPPTPARAAPR